MRKTRFNTAIRRPIDHIKLAPAKISNPWAKPSTVRGKKIRS